MSLISTFGLFPAYENLNVSKSDVSEHKTDWNQHKCVFIYVYVVIMWVKCLSLCFMMCINVFLQTCDVLLLSKQLYQVLYFLVKTHWSFLVQLIFKRGSWDFPAEINIIQYFLILCYFKVCFEITVYSIVSENAQKSHRLPCVSWLSDLRCPAYFHLLTISLNIASDLIDGSKTSTDSGSSFMKQWQSHFFKLIICCFLLQIS